MTTQPERNRQRHDNNDEAESLGKGTSPLHRAPAGNNVVWDERELWDRERIEAFQLHRLRAQIASVYERSPWYRERWDAIGFEPGGLNALDDLAQLPVTTKEEYQGALAADPPWGDALAADRADIRRVHFSSGTTQDPTPMYWTATDLVRWADLYARMAYSQGVRASDVFQCLFSYSWFVGGLGTTAAYERIGAAVIPGGAVDSERQIRTLLQYGTTALAGTPSFVLYLSEVATRLGIDLRDSAVRSILVGGEPGGAVEATRARIEEVWGARCFDGYGSLEFQPIAWECEAQAGGHLAEDFAYAEVLSPDTKEPVADGEPGVLVLTHLDKEACPLVRWWTNDIVVRNSDRCSCGRTHARLAGGVRGRADDMLVVRGVNLFPTAIEHLVRSTVGTTGEYRIVLDDSVREPGSGYLNAIRLQVEAEPDVAQEALGETLATAIRDALRVRAHVEVVDAGRLPRHTHKAARLVDLSS